MRGPTKTARRGQVSKARHHYRWRMPVGGEERDLQQKMKEFTALLWFNASPPRGTVA
jgi:hypothetical protein